MNPANPRIQFHKLDRAKDPNFWSVRASHDIRLIVHKTAKSLLLCYIGHHDKAYHWAERRKLETHPKTVADDSDLEEVYNTERHLLYVACTRARNYLLVASSEFLDDLRM